MLLIKTKIGKSDIHGIGLFADQFIEKGTEIWELNDSIDKIITHKEFEELPLIARKTIIHFSHFDKKINAHVLCGDNARFFNRSNTPNCIDKLGKTIAGKDIHEGEELTEVYYNLHELFYTNY